MSVVVTVAGFLLEVDCLVEFSDLLIDVRGREEVLGVRSSGLVVVSRIFLLAGWRIGLNEIFIEARVDKPDLDVLKSVSP